MKKLPKKKKLDKYQLAIIEYYQASQNAARLTKEISRNLSLCPDQKQDENNMTATHLKAALYGEIANGYITRRRTDYEQLEYLSETCQHCYAAYNLIHERMQYKKTLGYAKRRLSLLALGLVKNASKQGGRANEKTE